MRGHRKTFSFCKTDGTGLQQLTNDVYKDRFPRWSPDGNRIAFHSNRGGKHDVWLINTDGSALERLTYAPAPAVYFPVWSPDGKRLAYTIPAVGSFVMDVAKPWKEQSPKLVSVPPELGATFHAWSWSPDGRQLAGNLQKADAPDGLGVYSLESGKLGRLTRFGTRPMWLSDSHKLVFANQGKLYLTDDQTGTPREIISLLPQVIETPSLTRDDRQMYFSVVVTEADIWLATIE